MFDSQNAAHCAALMAPIYLFLQRLVALFDSRRYFLAMASFRTLRRIPNYSPHCIARTNAFASADCGFATISSKAACSTIRPFSKTASELQRL